MKDEIKQRLQKTETWMRGLYMLLFIFVYGLMEFVIILVMLFQFISIVLSGHTNVQLLKFSQNLAAYVYQIITFLTFNSEQLPFPFSAWPSEKTQYIEDDQ
ncbi:MULTISPECIES: DUF4389 domain-containing protein [Nitrosomonas]|uniref:Lipase n=1 Tax=Nitrosomonas communis TaxID=44574 RepID=A0A0F7KGK6_9PROT|nr:MULTISPECIES: DUF4389 domain-containing protein [Nitrosomonas]AKH37957.1 lipase [Nitrosomonas communis]TYP85017.1 uncharacterized protein DUF4389 [Nitrosomonas communis]UVS63332.1 DUF4389 domain-containing protein [Nitrosomonas sp. PLL12]